MGRSGHTGSMAVRPEPADALMMGSVPRGVTRPPVGSSAVVPVEHLEVPAVEAVLAPVHDHHPGLPALLGRVGVQVGTSPAVDAGDDGVGLRSEEHTSELTSLMRISYAAFC